jgi:hypothetical protein
MTRHRTMRRLGVTVGAALMCCVYAGVASAEDSFVAAGGEAEAVAETSESTAAETSKPARAVGKGKKSAEPGAETSEPVSPAPETSPEPGAETSEPVSPAPEPSPEPVAETSEPVSPAPETSPEPAAETGQPVSDAGAVAPGQGLPIGSPLTPKSINVLRDVFSDLAAAASGDPRARGRTDRPGAGDDPPITEAPSPLLQHEPQAPAPVAPAGASGAPGGGSSGGFMALVGVLLLASIPLSRVVELSLTRVRTPRLVADLARPD